MDDKYTAALAYATALGAEHGRNAASWLDIEDEDSARRIIRLIEDGDPEVYNILPGPDLSGQWADSLNGPRLAHDAFEDAGMVHSTGDADADPMGHAPGTCEVCDAWDATGEVCDAYDAAFSLAVEDEVTRRARYMIE